MKKLINLLLFFASIGSIAAVHAVDNTMSTGNDARLYINDANGEPLFYLGDTAWFIMSADLTSSQIKQYLDNRKAKGFNVIQLDFTPYYYGSANGGGNTKASGDFNTTGYVNLNGHTPYSDMKNPITPEKFNPDYWDRVRTILGWIKSRGLKVYVRTGHALRPQPKGLGMTGSDKAWKHGWSMANEVASFNDMIIWAMDWDHRTSASEKTLVKFMAEGIADRINGVPYSRGRDGRADYSTTFMSTHEEPGTSSFKEYGKAAFLDFSAIQSYGNLDLIDKYIEYDVNNAGMPTILVEGAYEATFHPVPKYDTSWKRYKHNGKNYYADEFNFTTDGYRKGIKPWHIRYQAYQTVFLGAAGYGYGHRASIQSIDATHSDTMNAPGGADLHYLAKLFDGTVRPGYDLRNLAPNQKLIAADSHNVTETAYIAAVRSTDKRLGYIYSTAGLTIYANLNLIGADGDRVRAYWYDVKTGQETLINTFARSASQAFNPVGGTGYDMDVALILERVGKPAVPAKPQGLRIE